MSFPSNAEGFCEQAKGFFAEDDNKVNIAFLMDCERQTSYFMQETALGLFRREVEDGTDLFVHN